MRAIRTLLSLAVIFSLAVLVAIAGGDIDVLSASALNQAAHVAWYENTDGAGTMGPLTTLTNAADNVQVTRTPAFITPILRPVELMHRSRPHEHHRNSPFWRRWSARELNPFDKSKDRLPRICFRIDWLQDPHDILKVQQSARGYPICSDVGAIAMKATAPPTLLNPIREGGE